MSNQHHILEKYRIFLNGKYGLSDEFYRNIWLNISDHRLALDISKTFSSKIRLVVFDLSIFENYTDTLLDSTCCLNWQLPLSPLWESAVTKRFDDPITQTIHTQHQEKLLINCPYQGLHTPANQNELQLQMILYIRLIKKLLNKKRYTYSEDAAHKFIQSIKDIFFIEIKGNIIIDKLYSLAVSNLDTTPNHSAGVLDIIGMLYE